MAVHGFDIRERYIQPATCKSDSDQDIHNEFNIFIIGKNVYVVNGSKMQIIDDV